jgi:RNA polymerase sigma factor (sigma-70 family)
MVMPANSAAEFRAAFPELFRRAYQAAFRLTGDRSASEELAQEALLQAYRHWDRLDQRREGWVVTTATNLAIGHWRKRDRRVGSRAVVAAPDWDALAVQRLDLAAALARLPRRQREVTVLRYLEDWSERRVADALGCSIGSVKQHASRGLAAVRSVINPPDEPALEKS